MPGTPTTKYAIPTFNAAGSDPVNTGHTQINSALSTIDGAMAGYATGTFAGKPAAGKAGRLYLCTDTGQWLADTGSAWVDLNAAPALVSSLPGSPYDGQEIYYSADPTNGVVWHLRYRSAAAGSYKWEMVGGGPLTSEVATSETTGSAGYVDLATVGPSITVPLAGDYAITLSSSMDGITIAALTSVKFGAAAASDADALTIESSGGDIIYHSPSRTIRRNVNSASMVVKLVYKKALGAPNFSKRSLVISPIRVG